MTDQEVKCKVGSCKRTWTWTADAQRRHYAWVARQQAKTDTATDAIGFVDATPDRASAVVGEASSTTPEVTADSVAEAVASQELVSSGPDGAPSSSEAATALAIHPAATDSAATSTGADESASAPPAGERRKKKRKSKRQRKAKPIDGPPERMCSVCSEKASKLKSIELPCKVHGCSRTFEWDRASQLRAWASVATTGDSGEATSPAVPKRMCTTCREFCRVHPDRAIKCGRPECASTWTYKTGAQLQAFLAGKLEDPIKLCDECAKGQFLAMAAERAKAAERVGQGEVMPCVVVGCEGSWLYMPGMTLTPAADGQYPADRMCDDCRVKHGEAPRGHAPGSEAGSDAVVVSDEDSSVSVGSSADAGAVVTTPTANAAKRSTPGASDDTVSGSTATVPGDVDSVPVASASTADPDSPVSDASAPDSGSAEEPAAGVDADDVPSA